MGFFGCFLFFWWNIFDIVLLSVFLRSRGRVIVYFLIFRFVIIILYLNDVVEGGEIVFLVVDDLKKYNLRNYLVILNKKCYEVSLLIKLKKGKVVMWYNYFLEYDGVNYMGKVDVFLLYGGCDVLEGVKWIVNIWINVLVELGGEI